MNHRDVQERKTLMQIEEKLEREYKFYQVKISAKEQSQEKVPELLLKSAADEAASRLSKVVPQFSSILLKLMDWYNSCIRTSISESQAKSKEIKNLNKEALELKSKIEELNKENESKNLTIKEISKELVKMKRIKKETDK